MDENKEKSGIIYDRDDYADLINKNANPVGSGRLQSVTLNVLGYNLVYSEVKENYFKIEQHTI